MAQTKRKRRTKHRGNAAGIVETRGRTGRRPSESERKPAKSTGGGRSGAGRPQRYEKPPTWKGSAIRGSLIALVGAVLIAAIQKSPAAGAGIFAFMLIFYIPFSYYTDLWLHRRWLRKTGQATKR